MANRRSGFLLLETMVGVAVFAIGVLVLARCVHNCLDAEETRRLDELARTVLENRMAEVQAGAVLVEEDAATETLSGRYANITLKQWSTPVPLENEERVQMEGIEAVHLEATWPTPHGPQTKTLTFYALDAP